MAAYQLCVKSIFMDEGAGFSYSRTLPGSQTGDTKFSDSINEFLRKVRVLKDCNGEYVDVDSSNIQCANDLQAISNITILFIKCTEGIQQTLVTTPKCPSSFRGLLIRRPGDPNPSRCSNYNNYGQITLLSRKHFMSEGFTRGFSNHLTYATGGGHTAPDDMPKECYNMFKRWISHEPL
ncbi:serine carboxypeptidase-like 7 [Quercus suber]|uniref:Serine carboxypeptidase-like 7 n=1 Tax=Quercus suber TaxID=58331 RepID=A0AAW0L2P7_QUESU